MAGKKGRGKKERKKRLSPRWSKSTAIANKKQFQSIVRSIDKVLVKQSPCDDLITPALLAPFVSLHWLIEDISRNPLWVMLVAPPGSGKTARLLMFDECEELVLISSITTNTLMSGYRDPQTGKDPSLLPMLNGKVFGVKDISPILQDKTTRDMVFSQLRDAYDGNASKGTGMHGLVRYESTFNAVVLATPIIDSFFSLHLQLGERFVSLRYNPMVGSQAPLQAIDNTLDGKKDALARVRKKMKFFLQTMHIPKLEAVKIPQDIREFVVDLASFACSLRTHVPRERSGQMIAAIPQPEVATRLSTQLTMFAAALMVATGELEVTETIRRALIWACRSSVSAVRIYTLFCLWRLQVGLEELGESPWVPPKLVQQDSRLGYHTVHQILTDFNLLRIVDAKIRGTGRRGARYCIEPEIMDFIEDIGFFGGFEAEYEVQDVIQASWSREKRRD